MLVYRRRDLTPDVEELGAVYAPFSFVANSCCVYNRGMLLNNSRMLPKRSIFVPEGEIMLRVAVSGYYGFNNTGDEAILAALVATMRTLSPGVEITVFSHHPQETRRLFGVHAVNRWNPFGVIFTLLRSDLLLSGGGGLLQDVTGVRSLCYYLAVVALAKLFGKPVVYYAQGVGPVRTRFGRWLTRVISNRVDLITVRDQASKDDFLEMGVDRPPVVVTADPVLAVSQTQFGPEPGAAVLEKLRKETGEKASSPAISSENKEKETDNSSEKKRTLGIAIRDWKDCYDFKKTIAAAADRLVRDGWEIIFIPFHFPRDLHSCQETSWLMQEPSLLVDFKLSVEELFSLLGQVDLVLGMRLHALVMASVMKTPCVGITYDPKVERFLEITGQSVAGTVENLDEERLYREIVETWEKRDEIVAHLDQVLIPLRQRAWETAGLTMSVFYSRYPHRRGECRTSILEKRR